MIRLTIVLFLTTRVAASPAADQTELIARIQRASPADRIAAVTEAKRIGAADRSPALVAALAHELIRVNSLVEKWSRGVSVVDPEWDTVPVGDYLGSLVELNAQSRDPVVLPALIGAIRTGNMAMRAVAAFGAVTVEPLLGILRNGSDDPGNRHGAAMTLEMILTGTSLMPGQREAIVGATKMLLQREEHVVVTGAAITLAVTTGDTELIEVVRRIAEDPAAARVSGGDPSDLIRAQDRAQEALAARRQ